MPTPEEISQQPNNNDANKPESPAPEVDPALQNEPTPNELHPLIKTPEEIFAEIAKRNSNRLKLMVFLGTIIVMIIVSAYVLKSGANLQGNLANVSDDLNNIASEEFCEVNEYQPLDSDSCIEIPRDQCDLLVLLKNDPFSYKIEADTLKQDWWQDECVEETQMTSPDSIMDNPTEETVSEPVETTSATINEFETFDPEIIATEQPIDCGKAKADASIFTDKGFIDQAYETQVSQLVAPECHPEYDMCQRRLASAVAAKAYMTFAESITKSIVSLRNNFDENADAFYGDPTCFATEYECTRLKTSGITPATPEDSLPLSLIAPAAEKNPSSTSEPTTARSPFSQEALEYSIAKTISDNTLFTEKQFYERYCVPKPVAEPAENTTTTQSTPKVKRAS